MIYLSTKTYSDVEIDLATATLDQLLDAYNSLLDRSDDGGAYPTSKAAAKARAYRAQLNELIAARPEIEQYRADVIAGKVALANAGRDQFAD